MLARRKPFRVETMTGRANGHANGHASGPPQAHHHEIMSELRELRSSVKPAEQVSLKMIETHILRMMEIWGGLDAFKDIEAEKMRKGEGEAGLVNGPRIGGEAGHASQDDIDALFA